MPNWPPKARSAAVQVFGANGLRYRSTDKKIEKAITDALALWIRRHGPLNQLQTTYADKCLARAIREGDRQAHEQGGVKIVYILRQIEFVRDHEETAEGFKARTESVQEGSVTAIALQEISEQRAASAQEWEARTRASRNRAEEYRLYLNHISAELVRRKGLTEDQALEEARQMWKRKEEREAQE